MIFRWYPSNCFVKYTVITTLACIIAFLAKFDRLKSLFLQKITCDIGGKIWLWLQAVWQNLYFEKHSTFTRKWLEILSLFFQLTAFEQFPYPAYTSSVATIIVGFLMPLFMVLSFAFIIPPVLKRIVQEKQSGVKELMKMMGLPTWMNWVFYFFDAIVTLIISIIIMVVLIHVEWKSGEGKVIEFSDGSVVFFFFLIYSMSLVVFLFSISTVFSNRKFALCSRNFQNVKLRLDFVEVWSFYRHSDFTWNQISESSQSQNATFGNFRVSEFWFLVNLSNFQVLNLPKFKVQSL